MKLGGRRELPFPRPAVWAALMDPDVLSRTLPGCERLERTGEGTFAGTLSVAVGPVRGRFDGTLALTEVEPPEGYRMKLHGEGPSGFLSGEGTVRLEVAPSDATTVVYDLDAQVGGRIAGVGQRLLDSSAKVIARQGLDGLERQLAARHGAAAAGAGDSPPAEDGSPVAGEPYPAASSDAAPGPTAMPPADPAAAAWALGGTAAADHHVAPDPVAPDPVSSGPGSSPWVSPDPASPGPASPGPGPVGSSSPAPLAPAPSQTEFAGQFLRGLWQEMVPPAARPWVVAGGVLLLALLAAFVAWLLA